MPGSIHRWPPSLVQNAQLSFTKQPPEDGGLSHQPDASIWKARNGARRESLNGALLLRLLCRMKSFGPDNLIEIT